MQTPTRSKANNKTTAKSAPSRAAVALYPYQERWVRDQSRFKLAVKATQIGYSFAAALEAVLDCLEHRTLWIVLSRGERQSDEFMQKIRQHTEAMRIVGSKLDTTFFEKAEIRQHQVTFPNGSRIIGLPANPDTARGYTGNMILDEFAFHQQDREIWAAAFGRISRGDLKLRVISTPNGQRGKYYELAKELGLMAPPRSLPYAVRACRTSARRSACGWAISGGGAAMKAILEGNFSGAWEGWLMLVGGLTALGLGHKLDKLTGAVESASTSHAERSPELTG